MSEKGSVALSKSDMNDIKKKDALFYVITAAGCFEISLWSSEDLLKSTVIFLLALILTVIAYVDIKTYTIPDRLTLCMLAIAVITFLPVFDFTGDDIRSRAAGIFAASLPMIVVNLIAGDCFGGGDIKLIAACGLMLGTGRIIETLMISLVAAGVYAAVLLITHKKTCRQYFAFGPFISFGVMIVVLMQGYRP